LTIAIGVDALLYEAVDEQVQPVDQRQHKAK